MSSADLLCCVWTCKLVRELRGPDSIFGLWIWSDHFLIGFSSKNKSNPWLVFSLKLGHWSKAIPVPRHPWSYSERRGTSCLLCTFLKHLWFFWSCHGFCFCFRIFQNWGHLDCLRFLPTSSSWQLSPSSPSSPFVSCAARELSESHSGDNWREACQSLSPEILWMWKQLRKEVKFMSYERLAAQCHVRLSQQTWMYCTLYMNHAFGLKAFVWGSALLLPSSADGYVLDLFQVPVFSCSLCFLLTQYISIFEFPICWVSHISWPLIQFGQRRLLSSRFSVFGS